MVNIDCAMPVQLRRSAAKHLCNCPQTGSSEASYEQIETFACQFKINTAILPCSGNLRTREDLE
jgi:hypothetical protein